MSFQSHPIQIEQSKIGYNLKLNNMSNLATIFTKIKTFFETSIIEPSERENIDFFFPMVSIGYTNEDFLFLESNNANDQVQAYYDELMEFSYLTNNIPRKTHIWSESGNKDDLLFEAYSRILNNLQLVDVDSISISKLQDHPIFNQILQAIPKHMAGKYLSYNEQYKRLLADRNNAKPNSVHQKNTDDAIGALIEDWKTHGNKEAVEERMQNILVSEARRFIANFREAKSKLEVSWRSKPDKGDFVLTNCFPNNLYESDKLNWRSILIKSDEIKSLRQKAKRSGYESIFQFSDLGDLELEEIKFEVVFVNVHRPWFDEDILKSPFWDIFMLDSSGISIPKYVTKLVFSRNMELKLKKNSTVNANVIRKIKQKDTLNGPFAINLKMLNHNKISLSSAYQPKQLRARAITKKGAKSAKSGSTMIAGRMLNAMPMTVLAKPVESKPKPTNSLKIRKPLLTMPPRMITSFMKLPSVTVQLKLLVNNQFVDIDPGDIGVIANGKDHKVKVSRKSKGVYSFNLADKGNYTIRIDAEGYQTEEMSFSFTASEKKSKKSFKAITLAEELITRAGTKEEFQLVAVICNKIPAYPNPLPNVDYANFTN